MPTIQCRLGLVLRSCAVLDRIMVITVELLKIEPGSFPVQWFMLFTPTKSHWREQCRPSPPLFPLPTSSRSRDHPEVISTKTTCLGPTRSGLACAHVDGWGPLSVGGMSGCRERGWRQKTADRHVSNISCWTKGLQTKNETKICVGIVLSLSIPLPPFSPSLSFPIYHALLSFSLYLS